MKQSLIELIGELGQLTPIVAAQARRPFVVEITGTPKAGKTSTIRRLEGVLAAAGWDVQVVPEAAETCPIRMKGHLLFNTWTTCTALRELVAAVDSRRQLVILDRGLFDARIWLELQRRRGQVTDEEARVFSSFVMLDRWNAFEDLVLVLRATPSTAMDRERLASPGSTRKGSLMNEQALGELNEAVESLLVGDGAPTVIDTDAIDQETLVELLAREILAAVRSTIDPEVAVVSRSEVERLFGDRDQLAWSPDGEWQTILQRVTYETRSVAEASDDLVQLISACVPTSTGGLFRFDRSEAARAAKYGRYAIWKGTHVARSDGKLDLERIVLDRVRGDLHLNALDSRLHPLGLVWTPNGERNHLCAAFELRLVVPDVVQYLHDRSFKTGTRLDVTKLSLHTSESLLAEPELEPWSRVILEAKWLTDHQ